jgi:hypothetical protein
MRLTHPTDIPNFIKCPSRDIYFIRPPEGPKNITIQSARPVVINNGGFRMTQNIDRYFFLIATLFAVLGMGFGISMGMVQDFSLQSMHSHLLLIGWATLALFGIGYRLDFAAKNKLAVAHFIFAVAGAAAMPLGIYCAVRQNQHGVAIIGSLLILVATLLFLVNVWRRR